MVHRHIIETDVPSLAAIDDIIDRGGVADWRGLKARVDDNPLLAGKVLRVCAVKVPDPYAQRYHLWNYYAKRVLT